LLETFRWFAYWFPMTVHLDTLLEGSPAYGVVDAKDGAVLFRRSGHEAAFDALAAEVLDAAGSEFEAIPLTDDNQRCDRLFVAPLGEHRSFAPR